MLAFSSPVFPVQPVEIYTYDILPPFAFRDDSGKLTGIYIEMVRRAVERMPDYSATFQVIPWARAKNLTKKGKAFAILPPYFHAHDWLTDDTKEPYIWPYFLALHYQSDVVICNEEVVMNTPKPNFPEDYKGLTFVMFRGMGEQDQNSMRWSTAERLSYKMSIKQIKYFLFYKPSDQTVLLLLNYLLNGTFES